MEALIKELTLTADSCGPENEAAALLLREAAEVLTRERCAAPETPFDKTCQHLVETSARRLLAQADLNEGLDSLVKGHAAMLGYCRDLQGQQAALSRLHRDIRHDLLWFIAQQHKLLREIVEAHDGPEGGEPDAVMQKLREAVRQSELLMRASLLSSDITWRCGE